ncbi:MAG TPA: hypothetical protein PKJ62_07245 [Bacteroidia bacterium]|nr:hypothetical protein [Bacteroidia bacterium]HNS11392.1 hypothetical protein [Bacteroidia bacterium]
MNFKLSGMKAKTRQKQKLRMRNIILVSVFFMSVSTMGLILFFHLNEPSISQAKVNSNVNVVLVKDQELLTDKSIETVRLADRAEAGQNTLFVKAVKRENISVQN